MGKRIEFRFSGSGGQGIISAGIILAAAAVHDGKYAIQSQSYGPEARGGSSKAEVVISEEPIDYPKATTPDYLLCLTDDAFKTYGLAADDKTVIFVDSSMPVANGSARPCAVCRVSKSMYPGAREEQPIPETITVLSRSRPSSSMARIMFPITMPLPQPGHQIWGIWDSLR